MTENFTTVFLQSGEYLKHKKLKKTQNHSVVDGLL